MFDALVVRVQRALFGDPREREDYGNVQPDWSRPAPGLPQITITKIKNKDDDEPSPTPLCIIR